MMTFLEITEVLKYDSDELRSSTFTVYERWALAQERSLLLDKNDERKSYISKSVVKRCEMILDKIKDSNWSRSFEKISF